MLSKGLVIEESTGLKGTYSPFVDMALHYDTLNSASMLWCCLSYTGEAEGKRHDGAKEGNSNERMSTSTL